MNRRRDRFDRVCSGHGEADLIQLANEVFAFRVEASDALRTDQFSRFFQADLRLDGESVETVEKEFPGENADRRVVAKENVVELGETMENERTIVDHRVELKLQGTHHRLQRGIAQCLH